MGVAVVVVVVGVGGSCLHMCSAVESGVPIEKILPLYFEEGLILLSYGESIKVAGHLMARGK